PSTLRFGDSPRRLCKPGRRRFNGARILSYSMNGESIPCPALRRRWKGTGGMSDRIVGRIAAAFGVVSLIALVGLPDGCGRILAEDADDPVVTEFDVVPDWPKRPENVSGKGWVSGMAVDAEDRVWFFRKGPDPVQVYTADGEFVRTWGKGMFENPHHL